MSKTEDADIKARYKPYPRYKDSGIEWLGKIPEGWSAERMKFHVPIQAGYAFKSDDFQLDGVPVVRMANLKETRLELSDAMRVSPANALDEFALKEGDVLMGMSGSVGLTAMVCASDLPCQLNQRVGRFIFRTKRIVPGFLRYFVRSQVFTKRIVLNSTGTAQLNVSPEEIGDSWISIPQKDEQRAIAEFLDRETAKMDNLIARKERLIELLEEKRSAFITHAVTRGLDPNAPLRDSDIEWLGQIPAHWEVQRLKFILDRPLEYGASETSEHTNPDWPRFIRITDLNEDGSLREESFRSLPPEVAEHYLVSAGDLLFARSGATVGKSFLYRGDTSDKACFAGYLIRAAIDRKKARPEFVWFFTRSDKYRSWLTQVAIQATIQNISAERYANLWVPMPSLSEQDAILESIREGMTILDRLVATVTNAIERLKECRSALITAAVTGKIDVRDEVKAAA